MEPAADTPTHCRVPRPHRGTDQWHHQPITQPSSRAQSGREYVYGQDERGDRARDEPNLLESPHPVNLASGFAPVGNYGHWLCASKRRARLGRWAHGWRCIETLGYVVWNVDGELSLAWVGDDSLSLVVYRGSWSLPNDFEPRERNLGSRRPSWRVAQGPASLGSRRTRRGRWSPRSQPRSDC